MAPFASKHYAVMHEILMARQPSTATRQTISAIEARIAAITRYDDKRLITVLLLHPDSSEHVRLLRSMINRGALGPQENEHSTPIMCAWIRTALPQQGCRIRGDRFGESGCLYRDPLEGETVERPTRSQTKAKRLQLHAPQIGRRCVTNLVHESSGLPAKHLGVIANATSMRPGKNRWWLTINFSCTNTTTSFEWEGPEDTRLILLDDQEHPPLETFQVQHIEDTDASSDLELTDASSDLEFAMESDANAMMEEDDEYAYLNSNTNSPELVLDFDWMSESDELTSEESMNQSSSI